VKLEAGRLRLSATDLANHLACRHLTALDRAVAEGRAPAPAWRDPSLALLRERGAAHEAAYVAHLRAAGVDVVELADVDPGEAASRTAAAMAAGAGAIVQAALADGAWSGRADLLVRVAGRSRWGDWAYEVHDTKLALETRAGTILQLCLYTDLVAELQDSVPGEMHVIRPGFERETFRTDDLAAYYRLVRRRLEAVAAAPPGADTYPVPIEHCEICRWRLECDTRRHDDDHLSLVAGIRALHVGELERQGVSSLTAFADAARPLPGRPRRGTLEAFARAHGQARTQLRGRRHNRPVYELLPAEPGLGFARLPEPSGGDVFLDIESDPFVDGGGLEYLIGIAVAGGDGETRYDPLWALDAGAERRAFEMLIDRLLELWAAHPGMHVYHFSPYEPAALRRLAGRCGTREDALSRLLRGERFADLLAVTRQGLRASVESYSLKALEAFTGFARAVELPAAAAALRHVAAALERGAAVAPGDRTVVQAYNRDDCLATAALRDWLETRRAELVSLGQQVPRPPLKSGDASDKVEERSSRTRAVFERLTAGLPQDADRSAWDGAARARWLLAHQLDYFRREENCAWWEYFRIRELDDDGLLEERNAIAGLRPVGPVDGGKSRSPVHRYSFPPQEVALDSGDRLDDPRGDLSTVGTVQAIDLVRHILDIKGTGARRELSSVVGRTIVGAPHVEAALLAFARSVAEHGIDGSGPYRAARDLLLRLPPRLRGAGPLQRDGEGAVEAAVRLAFDLQGGVLPIQGPPGTGKSYTGARMIAALAAAGKRVGVTAVSHKVVLNLLATVRVAAAELGVPIGTAHQTGNRGEDLPDGVEGLKKEGEALAAVKSGKVVGGTAWLWARDEMEQQLDFLFVDEAGQMALAPVLAVGRSARNIVLLGDPQQLEQPQRGAHPEGAGVAALVHVLGGNRTMPADRGLFLGETWRLHPRICRFTSEAYYESRLVARPGLARQAITGDPDFSGSGLFYVPVPHAGNRSSSSEEASIVARIVQRLLAPAMRYTDRDGRSRPVAAADVIVVAPYNAQVSALIAALPGGVRAGTVDRFQGQEAPVVIYSMASSTAEDAPRGMGFLYDPHRLNVATSRARCAAILVASPRLLEPECRSPWQMTWANGLCRFREMATEVTLPAPT
jgi:predicted RecB family nuclease